MPDDLLWRPTPEPPTLAELDAWIGHLEIVIAGLEQRPADPGEVADLAEQLGMLGDHDLTDAQRFVLAELLARLDAVSKRTSTSN